MLPLEIIHNAGGHNFRILGRVKRTQYEKAAIEDTILKDTF